MLYLFIYQTAPSIIFAITDKGLLFIPNALIVLFQVLEHDNKTKDPPPTVRRSVGLYEDNGFLAYDKQTGVIDLVEVPGEKTWSTGKWIRHVLCNAARNKVRALRGSYFISNSFASLNSAIDRLTLSISLSKI
ncbi:MAG: hypothetical protein ACD_3C00018G0011 [uncultured bacterium (gcode 4)]|uniref:Uncharacterized protein n=1 Tax=uncultured bacterium (gcode 4) TaxID=1234023 RepID=K2G376_9BACT|nr:MAG: hypothetical protein ACD_3C00018G0011 [uncultured bacterium (gcode 4)]